MTQPFQRATRRPAEMTKPAHWTNDPVPEPQPPKLDTDPEDLDPTRFGDWTLKGVAVDF